MLATAIVEQRPCREKLLVFFKSEQRLTKKFFTATSDPGPHSAFNGGKYESLLGISGPEPACLEHGKYALHTGKKSHFNIWLSYRRELL